MNTYTRLPTPETAQSGSALSNHFLHTAPYAPRRTTAKIGEKSMVRWEDEGGSLAGPQPV
jgi:hypothetical protein